MSQVEAIQELLDRALEPVKVDTAPAVRYTDEVRDYSMTIGMERCPGGRLWSAWVGGGDNDKGYFLLASSDDDGRSWSRPRVAIDPEDAPGVRQRTLVGNLWLDPLGRLWLFYDQSLGYFDGRAGDCAIVCGNPEADEPKWSEPRRIWHGCTLNKPTVLSTGEWMLPISLWDRGKIHPRDLFGEHFHDLDDLRMAHVFVSTDQGQSWQRRGGTRVPEAQAQFDEHMILERRDGSLRMLLRTTYGIAESTSVDCARTWSEPVPSAIAHTPSRFFLRRLQSGRVLLVKNGSSIREKPVGRAQMTAFLSEDDGHTWVGGLVLDERTGVSYPDGTQAPDGTLYIQYDRNRDTDAEILMAVFTEEDILAGRPVSAKARLRVLVSKARGHTTSR